MSEAIERLLVEIESQVKGDNDLRQFFAEYNKMLQESNLSQQQMVARLREVSRAFAAGGGERAYLQFLGDVTRRFTEIGRPLDETARRVEEISKAFARLDPKVKDVIARFSANVPDELFGQLEQAGVRIEKVLTSAARSAGSDPLRQIQAVVEAAGNLKLPKVDLDKIFVGQGSGYATLTEALKTLPPTAQQAAAAAAELAKQEQQAAQQAAYAAQQEKEYNALVQARINLSNQIVPQLEKQIEAQAKLAQGGTPEAEAALRAFKNGANKLLSETLSGLQDTSPDQIEQTRKKFWEKFAEFESREAQHAAGAIKTAQEFEAQGRKRAQIEIEEQNAEEIRAKIREIGQSLLKEYQDSIAAGTDPAIARGNLDLQTRVLGAVRSDATLGIIQNAFQAEMAFYDRAAAAFDAEVKKTDSENAKSEEQNRIRAERDKAKAIAAALVSLQAEIYRERDAALKRGDSPADVKENVRLSEAVLRDVKARVASGIITSADEIPDAVRAATETQQKLAEAMLPDESAIDKAVGKLQLLLAGRLQAFARADPKGAEQYRDTFNRVLKETVAFAKDAQITGGDQFVTLFFDNLKRAFAEQSAQFQQRVEADQKKQADAIRAAAERLVQLSPEIARGYVALFQQAREQVSREAAQLTQQVEKLQSAPLRGGESQAQRFTTLAAAIDALTQRKAQIQQLDAALQQLGSGKGVIDRQALGDARNVVQIIASTNRQIEYQEQVAQRARGGVRAWLQEFDRLRNNEARAAVSGLMREIERSIPTLGFFTNPLATVARNFQEIVRTGGPVGGILRAIGDAARGMLGSLQRIGETAIGFVVGNILLAPFNALRNGILGVINNFDSFVRRAIDLNRQLGKTREEVAEDAKVFDQFLLVVSKPTFDFLTQQVNRAGAALSKSFGMGADWKANLFAFGAALGDELRTAAQNLLAFGDNIFRGGGSLDPQQWLMAGANLAAQFGEGLIQGFIALIPVVASLVQHIADFFIGHSPPPLGALRRIVEGGQGVINEWFRGMLNADFSMLDQLTAAVESRLNLAIANKTMKQAELPGAIAGARDAIADMLAELTTNGSVAAGTLERLRGLFGDMWGDVQRVIGAMGEWRNATIAVQAAQEALNAASERLRAIQEEISNALEAAQEHVKAVQEQVEAAVKAAQNSYEDAQKAVQAIQDKITAFEQNTAEIPERFTRGRRRELDVELIAAQKRAQLAQEYLQDVQKAGQEQVKNAQKELEAIQKNGQERLKAAQKEVEAAQKALQAAQKEEQIKQAQLQLAERLLAEDVKRNQLLAQRAGMNVDIRLPDIDEALKKAFAGAFEKVNQIFKEKLADDVKMLGDFFRTLFTGEVQTEVGPEGNKTVTRGSQIGLQLRESLEAAQKAWDKTAPEVLAFLKALLLGEATTDKNGVESAASKAGAAVRKFVEDSIAMWNSMPPQLQAVIAALVAGHVATGGVSTLALLAGTLGLLGTIGGKLLDISVIPAFKALFGGGAAGAVAGDAAGANAGLPMGQFFKGGSGGGVGGALGIAGWIAGIATAISVSVNGFVGNMAFFTGIGESIQGALSNGIEKPFKDFTATLPSNVKTFLNDSFDAIKLLFQSGLETLAGAFFVVAGAAEAAGVLAKAALRFLFGEDPTVIQQDVNAEFEKVKTFLLTGWELFVQSSKDALMASALNFAAVQTLLFGGENVGEKGRATGGLLSGIVSGFNGFVAELKALPEKIKSAMGDAGGWLDEHIAAPFRKLWDTLFGHSIIPDIESGFDAFVSFLTNLPSRIGEALGGIADAMKQAAQGIFDALPDPVKKFLAGGDDTAQKTNNGEGMAAKVQAEAESIRATYADIENRTAEFVTAVQTQIYALALSVEQRLTLLRDNFILLIAAMIFAAILQFNLLPVGVGLALNSTETAIYNFIARVETQWASFWNYMQNYAATVANNIATIVNSVLNSINAAASTDYPDRVGPENDDFGVGGGTEIGGLSRRVALQSGLARVARAGELAMARAAAGHSGAGNETYYVNITQTFPEGVPLWEREELRSVTRDAAYDAIARVMQKNKNRRQ